ncbi:permease [Teredinibacter haidensis]|uniref:permease n=1 Tax=Teredinibacter haidensis TaxID=2731755 RepID=UPI000948FFA5|nr:permease [Teredinibacter haidensis]
MEKPSCCSKSKSVDESPPGGESESCCQSKKESEPKSCCAGKPKSASTCCGSGEVANEKPSAGGCCETSDRPDYMLWGSLFGVALGYGYHLLIAKTFPEQMASMLGHLGHAIFELINTMAWGAALGIFMVALLCKVPRELVMSLLGTHGGLKGMLRATGAGLLLDLCSHGILMVGAKLYERGASTGQVMAFLIASPWNSFSLTLILIAMIGLGWTLTFIVASALVAIVTGLVFDALVARGNLPANPNTEALPDNFEFWPTAIEALKQGSYNHRSLWQFFVDGVRESRMVLRWLLFGVLLAAAIRTFVPPDYFGNYFGPTAVGLAVTLLVATVLEVCSEGSAPIAADIFNRAVAPGNSFAFLMTGVSTDYTEIMVLKDTTRSWKLALFLPLITVPQVVVIALALNGI